MSMNIHIVAEIIGTKISSKTGKEIQVKGKSIFDCWQTPTSVSYSIENAGDLNEQIQAYKDWVLSVSEERVFNVYAAGDIFKKGEPIGEVIVHSGKEHIRELDEWLAEMQKDEWEVQVEVW